ncbi:phosphatase PAP2 family protein [Polaribacter uvawellassae]|uniref:phosphatase PAP2 family protein n=1 Tax=Polaribacter uvawellassae TaxID=3133495 RepID=UPI00321A1F93
MFDILIQKDKELLIYLNSLGSEQWDPFWLFITNQFNWAPLFLLIIFLIFKKFGWKKGGFIFFFVIVLIAFSDQFTNLIRVTFERLRPNNDTSINDVLRTLITPQSYSFTSGHATTSMTFSVFVYFLFKESYKYIKYIFIFPIFFAYSRLYLGVHFPIDILTGATIGTIIGFSAFKLQHFLVKKIFTA